MTIREGSIVTRIWDSKEEPTDFRVEKVDGSYATIRSLEDYRLTEDHVDELRLHYQTDYFDFGDTVRVRNRYADSYNEADGANDLVVIKNSSTSGRVSTTEVANNNGEEFKILSERLHLVKPVKSFKAGDRVVVDSDLVKKYNNDGIEQYWRNTGVMILTEDSGSRRVQTTSHVRYENGSEQTNNVPTRWLKLYVEPTKRVVGETIKVKDIKIGDKVKATSPESGLLVEYTGTVGERLFGGPTLVADGGGVFPSENNGAVFTLLEEAPEPVDENLQRLLDTEIGGIAHGTYANEYWKRVEKEVWKLLDGDVFQNTEGVFGSLYKLKYGTLEIYRKVEDAN